MEANEQLTPGELRLLELKAEQAFLAARVHEKNFGSEQGWRLEFLNEFVPQLSKRVEAE